MSKQKYVFRGLALAFDRLAKAHAFNFKAYSSNCTFWGLLLVVVVLFVAQVCDQLVQSMRNSDPRVRFVFVHRFNSNFPLHLYLAGGWFWLLTRVQIWVFPRIQPFGSDDFSSLGKVYSRQATDSVNCETSSVSFVMKYCPTPTVVRNPASVQNLITRFCLWQLVHLVLGTFAIDLLAQDHRSKV